MIDIKNNIDFINYQTEILSPDLKDKITRALNEILIIHQIHIPVEVSIEFLNSREIKELNTQYRQIEKSTDVLSFPIYKSYQEIKEDDQNHPVLLGDVFICTDQAQKQAYEIGNSLEQEILYLTIHSFLHLLGYDHMNNQDKKEMRDLEKKIFLKLNQNDE